MEKISRRTFIKKSAAIGAASVLGSGIIPGSRINLLHAAQADLSIVTGDNYFKNTVAAVEALGGMKTFVSKGAKVGVLINCPFRNPGTHVNPDVALAVIKMCYDAGAKEVCCLKNEPDGYWEKSTLANDFKDVISKLKPSAGTYITHKIPGAKALKEADIIRELFECDLFINIPVTKNHEGTNFSCALKNMMGAAPHSTNRFFHQGTGTQGWYGDLDHMNQCIADINLVRKTDLCVSDSTEFITTNGPFGPGKIIKPKKVVAGADSVLVDAYCCKLLGLKPENVGMLDKAVAHGLGKTDLEKVNIQETKI
ncbi:DUF362 domain-containing protein [Desulfococcaceae bacterium HSG8]|nr:DUF362 domain-containing protein [Desulfococcaceae bacterium HSG8]